MWYLNSIIIQWVRYYNGQKILTPKQVTLVFEYLGEP